MIDLRALRDNPERFRASQRIRGEDETVIDRLLDVDSRRRSALSLFETKRAEQKNVGKEVSRASPEERDELLARAKSLSDEVKTAEADEQRLRAELDELLATVPNLVAEGVPEGGVDDVVVMDQVGTPREFDFTPRDHLELGEALGAIDTDRGAKVSGARFYFLTGVGAMLELGLLNMAMQQATASGFTPMVPPVLVKPEAMEGTGFLGAHSDEVYHLPDDELYLVGTSEVPLAGYHSGEILAPEDLPKRYSGWSSCFRREAGSYGKDTRGIIRVHQFNKVEMFVYAHPDHAAEEHLRLLAWERAMLDKLELPYRVVDIPGADLGTSAARKYDCEAWIPTQGRYRELTSTSNCTDFQARRLNIRYRAEEDKPRFAATLNGTLATTRWIVAILENHQQADGSVVVPEALRPYVGREVLSPGAAAG
ncbi:seryl-tRNA synthetase [Haloactinospora alba]|uniref:Serine--tRNA ligase n=1 Tax=Haloactinospora alba TaxID=405555 RepID=A0A543NA01_9ACTN|nr:serine--tRNA ligase [Haloactinospora alba]TQN28652.1 seryl-tRNA synthetase [Haloactinospora alba]